MKIEMASVSTEGQVVIPGYIRKSLGIAAGNKLMVATDGESVLMKPVNPPRLETFRELAEESRQAATEAGLTPTDVAQALAEVRRVRRGRYPRRRVRHLLVRPAESDSLVVGKWTFHSQRERSHPG